MGQVARLERGKRMAYCALVTAVAFSQLTEMDLEEDAIASMYKTLENVYGRGEIDAERSRKEGFIYFSHPGSPSLLDAFIWLGQLRGPVTVVALSQINYYRGVMVQSESKPDLLSFETKEAAYEWILRTAGNVLKANVFADVELMYPYPMVTNAPVPAMPYAVVYLDVVRPNLGL